MRAKGLPRKIKPCISTSKMPIVRTKLARGSTPFWRLNSFWGSRNWHWIDIFSRGRGSGGKHPSSQSLLRGYFTHANLTVYLTFRKKLNLRNFIVYCSFPRHVKNTFNSVNRASLTETVLQSSKEMRHQSKNVHTRKIAREIGLQNLLGNLAWKAVFLVLL